MSSLVCNWHHEDSRLSVMSMHDSRTHSHRTFYFRNHTVIYNVIFMKNLFIAGVSPMKHATLQGRHYKWVAIDYLLIYREVSNICCGNKRVLYGLWYFILWATLAHYVLSDVSTRTQVIWFIVLVLAWESYNLYQGFRFLTDKKIEILLTENFIFR